MGFHTFWLLLVAACFYKFSLTFCDCFDECVVDRYNSVIINRLHYLTFVCLYFYKLLLKIDNWINSVYPTIFDRFTWKYQLYVKTFSKLFFHQEGKNIDKQMFRTSFWDISNRVKFNSIYHISTYEVLNLFVISSTWLDS